MSWGLPKSGRTVWLWKLKILGSDCTVEMRWALYVSRLFMMSPAQDDSSCIWNVLTLETGKKRTNVIFVCVKCFKLVSAVAMKCKTQRQGWETNSVRVNRFEGGIQVMTFLVLWIYTLNSQWNEPRCTINKTNDTVGDVSRGLWVKRWYRGHPLNKIVVQRPRPLGISRIQNSETVPRFSGI